MVRTRLSQKSGNEEETNKIKLVAFLKDRLPFKGGKEVDVVRGANESKLREKMMHFNDGTWDPSMATVTKKDEGMTPT